MIRVKHISLLLGTAIALAAGQAHAFPGQTPEDATLWIRSHPTLQPTRGERLLVRKTETAAQRFTFLSSPLQVGKASSAPTGGRIRTEEISLFDIINGVTPTRLQESLRVIYGPVIYQDYAQARVLYAYPDQKALNQSTNRDTPLLGALQGEVREGDRYAYWLELARRPAGAPYTGKMTVFLKEDLPKLEAELRSR